jgi:3-oxoacyl-[acyl-carrier-protein] synthase II
VVTGVGLVTPLGVGTEETWQGLIAGRSGVGPITQFDASAFAARIAAEVKGFDPLNWVDKKDSRKMDRFIHFAVAAADLALKDAGLAVSPENAERVGVYIGSGIGGFSTIEREYRTLLESGPRRISPFFIPAVIINLASGWVSIRTGAKGPNSASCTACATSAHAVGDAFRIIQRGEADAMIAGGSEAAITPLAVGGFAAMRALSTRNDEPTRASRPFDQDRDGFVIGEGSGILILEELESARRHGAPIYAEIVGYAMTGDAYHVSAPCEDGDGARRVMLRCIEDAGAEPSVVDYINVHGTSTPAGDTIEVRAIKAVFGEHAQRLAISSTKSMTGHLLGAAGALETGVSALALRHGVLPPTINLDKPDAECDLDCVPHKARQRSIRYALSNSFGFGGTNAALLLRRIEA